MSSSTTIEARPDAVSRARRGGTFMVVSHVSSAIGIAATTGMLWYQGSAWINTPGTIILLAILLAQFGWLTIRNSLRPATWNSGQKSAIARIFLGNIMVNLAWPFAGQAIGIGAANAVLALGPVSVGLLEDIRERRVKPILLRVGVMAGIVLVTEPWDGASFSLLGVFAAACGAWHFWNIPTVLGRFGKEDDPETVKKQDLGMLVSNLFAMPFVLGTAIVLTLVQGESWVSGEVTLIALATVIGVGLFAAAFTMDGPILLQNRARNMLSKESMGVMFAFAPIAGLIVGTIGDWLGWVSGNQDISVLNVIGILMVSGFAYSVTRAKQGTEEADAVREQIGPDDEPYDVAAELREAEAERIRATQPLDQVIGERDRVTEQLGDVTAQRDEANAKLREAGDTLNQIHEQLDAVLEQAESFDSPGDGVVTINSAEHIVFTPGVGMRFAKADGVTFKQGGTEVTVEHMGQGSVGAGGSFTGHDVALGTVLFDGKKYKFAGARQIEVDALNVRFDQPTRISSLGGSAE